MIQNDLTDTEIAKLLKVSTQAINREIINPGASERIRKALCALTKVEPEIFWPELYDKGEVNGDAA